MSLPISLKTLLSELKAHDVCTTDSCKTCTGYKQNHCCTRPGFQTFENTVLIFEKMYSINMSYKMFIDTYYKTPVFLYRDYNLVIFYPKVHNQTNDNVSNGGCVFLKRKLTGETNEQFMNCSLYDDKSYDELTTFPIGCITDSATDSYEEYETFSEYRFSLINYYYPNSARRFNEKYGIA